MGLEGQSFPHSLRRFGCGVCSPPSDEVSTPGAIGPLATEGRPMRDVMMPHAGDSRCVCRDGRGAERDLTETCNLPLQGPAPDYAWEAFPPDGPTVKGSARTETEALLLVRKASGDPLARFNIGPDGEGFVDSADGSENRGEVWRMNEGRPECIR